MFGFGSNPFMAGGLFNIASIVLVAALVFLFTGLYKKNNNLTWAGGILMFVFVILMLFFTIYGSTSPITY